MAFLGFPFGSDKQKKEKSAKQESLSTVLEKYSEDHSSSLNSFQKDLLNRFFDSNIWESVELIFLQGQWVLRDRQTGHFAFATFNPRLFEEMESNQFLVKTEIRESVCSALTERGAGIYEALEAAGLVQKTKPIEQ